MTIALIDRYKGSLLGLACGDAVGTTVEFEHRGTFDSVTDMVGGGPFDLMAGQWTDDTSMALCLAESLLKRGKFDPLDQMMRYCNWWQEGYLSSTGDFVDIGITTQQALMRFQQTGQPFAGSMDPQTAGNGSLMRLAPIALFFFPDYKTIINFSADSSRTTHAAREAVECCMLFGDLLARALEGQPKESLIGSTRATLHEPRVVKIAEGIYRNKLPSEIASTGYCIESLEAALWCFYHTDTFEKAVLKAVNLGDDADTTAAIVGQLAGAYYGVQCIPSRWLDMLHMRLEIESTASSMLSASLQRETSVSVN